MSLIFVLVQTPAHADLKSDIESGLAAHERRFAQCDTDASDLFGQIKCVDDALEALKPFKESAQASHLAELGGSPEGAAKVAHFKKVDALWIQYRRDLCNFVAETKGNDKPRAKFVGLRCVFEATTARLREMFGIL